MNAKAATDAFVAHRNLLFTVAYEMLGSATDAEDVLQETWLRWAEVDPADVRDPRAYLVRVTMRMSLNQLRSQSRRRESYVGPWLPEPLLTSPDVAEDLEPAPDIVLITDGGGVKQAALRAIHGAEKVVRWLTGVTPVHADNRAEPILVNGNPGKRLISEGGLDTIATMRIEDGRVAGLYVVRNPHSWAGCPRRSR